MEVGQLSIEHLCSESKKIKKMKTKLDLIIASPKNSSEIVPHFKPVESNDFFLGRYILIDHLADGTFGRVFKAIDRYSFTPYAIKVIKTIIFLNNFLSRKIDC